MASSSHDLIQVRIEIEGLPEDAFSVVSIEGREAISKLFEIEISAVSTQGIDAEALLGQRAALVFDRDDSAFERDDSSFARDERAGEERRIHGIITRVHDGFETESAHWTCRLWFAPRAHRMTLQETLDIFMDLTVPEIVEKKLQAAGLVKNDDYELRLFGTYPKREFVVQYKETDLAFVSRLTEHIGLSFFFEHRDGRDVFVLTDATAGFESGSDVGSVQFRPRGDLRDVYRLESTARMIPSEYLVRDYNYRTPQVELAARADVDGSGGRIVEYGGHFKTNDEAARIAQVRSEEQLAARRVLDGESDVTVLRAGLVLRIEGHPWGDLDLLVTEVTHSITQVALGAAAGARRYTNRFRAIRKSTTYRPPRVTPKPRVPGVITGVVDAANAGQYAELDNEGRYRVKFLFDTSDAQNGQASRPVRMMQPHSGAGYGMHFPLRPGIEVLIVCVDGDPDRPIIAGTVPNPQTASPVVAGNAPRNIIRTGGNNEINIDDTDGAQRIKITTPRRNTLLQLGAQNDPIDGISLKTEGHMSAVAIEGASQWNSFGTQMSAMVNLLRSGTILNIASSPSLLGLAAAGVGMAQSVVVTGFPGVQELYGRNKSWIAQEQQRLLREEAEVNTNAVRTSQAAKAKLEGCNACRLAAKKLFPSRPTAANPSAPTQAELDAMAKYDSVKSALEAYENAVTACDDSYLSAIGTLEDRNGIVDVNRVTFANANFEPVMNRDAYSALSQYDYAKFEERKAAEDEVRWNTFTDEQRQAITSQGITKEQWLAAEKAKWVTTPVSDDDKTYYEATRTAADTQTFDDMSTDTKNSDIPDSVWEAAGIPAASRHHYADLTDAQKTSLKNAWLTARKASWPTPDLKAVRDLRRAALLAALGDNDAYYTAFTTKLAQCSAMCGTELDQAREAAIQGNETFFRKMKDDTPRMHQLADLSNKNDQALVTDMGTAINALLAVMAALELLFARTSLIERWAAANARALGAAGVMEDADLLDTLTSASAKIAKWSIPFINPQHTNVVGSDASTEVFGQRDLCMWSETAMLLGMGSKDRFGGMAAKAAAAAAIVGVPVPGDKPNLQKGKVLVMGMESVHVLSAGLVRMQAEDKLVAVSRNKANLLVKGFRNNRKQSEVALEKGKLSLSVLDDTEPAAVEKASVNLSLSNNKGVVTVKATDEHALTLNEDKQKTTLVGGLTNRLELNALANTAQLLARNWKLSLTQGHANGVHLGSNSWHLKIKTKEVILGGAGPKLKITDTVADLTSAATMKLAAPNEIKLETAKVVFGAAAIESNNLMVKADYDPTLLALRQDVNTAQAAANAAQQTADAAELSATNAKRTADRAFSQAQAANRRLRRL